ncbi:MAG: hypothetical protein HRT77_17295 [Halioglobus sp.]|nr:hypothetical protein [Halioglobus sp.]
MMNWGILNLMLITLTVILMILLSIPLLLLTLTRLPAHNLVTTVISASQRARGRRLSDELLP